MAIADDPQLAALGQCRLGLGEHAPGEEIADHLLLVERRIAQHQIQRGRRLLGQAVAGADIGRALAEDRLPVLARRLHRHVALVHQGQLRLRVTQRVDDAEHAVAAAEVGDT